MPKTKQPKRGKPARRKRPKPRAPDQAVEWIGGLVESPFEVADDGGYRPAMSLWMELPSGQLLAVELQRPDQAQAAFSASLRKALEHPAAGPRRRPGRVRVASYAEAEAVQAVLQDATPIRVAPCPELDDVVADLADWLAAERTMPESYLAGEGVTPELVEQLFRAAERLHVASPWHYVQDDQIVRLDVPELGVEGMCVSVIGALGQSLGLALFSSIEDFEAFLAAAELMEQGAAAPDEIDLGAEELLLSLDEPSTLPETMQDEIDQHGWPVAGPAAFPALLHVRSDGAAEAPTAAEVELATAAAHALASFFPEHRQLFERGHGTPVSESYSTGDGPVVRLTAPYQAWELFEEQPSPAAPRTKGGRDDP